MTHCIAIDIGGTKSAMGIIRINDLRIIHQESHASCPGLCEFPDFFGNLVKSALRMARHERILIDPMVVVALPGNFSPGSDIVIKKGSAKQLIKKNEDFEDLNITGWMNQQLPKDYSVYGVNDAWAQAIGTIHHHWCRELQDCVVLYIGPGTGLGGAIIRVGKTPHDVTMIGDGHIYDIVVQTENGNKMAEDILSGRAILETTGKVAKELSASKKWYEKNLQIIQNCGDCIQSIVTDIQNKTVVKVDPLMDWESEVKEAASKVGCIILGGSIGTKGAIGRYLFNRCNEMANINVIQSKDTVSNALIGAAIMKKIETSKRLC